MSFYRTRKLLSRGFIQNGTCQLEMWFYQRKTKVCATSGHLLESLKYTPAKMGTSEKSRLWKLMESLTSGGDVSGPLCSWKDQFTVGAATICQKNIEEIHIYQVHSGICKGALLDQLINLLLTVGCYPLDVITMSEIWLKNNNLLLYTLLCYLLLTYYPGYIHAFNSRNNTRIGGVGIYIKESIKFNRHTDLEKQYPNLEHLWVEIPGHNRHRVLLEIIYCSDLILPYNNWLNSLSHCLVT